MEKRIVRAQEQFFEVSFGFEAAELYPEEEKRKIWGARLEWMRGIMERRELVEELARHGQHGISDHKIFNEERRPAKKIDQGLIRALVLLFASKKRGLLTPREAKEWLLLRGIELDAELRTSAFPDWQANEDGISRWPQRSVSSPYVERKEVLADLFRFFVENRCRHRQIAVIGAPATGKTTLMTVLSQYWPIQSLYKDGVIVVDAQGIGELSNLPLQLARAIGINGASEWGQELDHRLNTGEYLLIIDQVDSFDVLSEVQPLMNVGSQSQVCIISDDENVAARLRIAHEARFFVGGLSEGEMIELVKAYMGRAWSEAHCAPVKQVGKMLKGSPHALACVAAYTTDVSDWQNYITQLHEEFQVVGRLPFERALEIVHEQWIEKLPQEARERILAWHGLPHASSYPVELLAYLWQDSEASTSNWLRELQSAHLVQEVEEPGWIGRRVQIPLMVWRCIQRWPDLSDESTEQTQLVLNYLGGIVDSWSMWRPTVPRLPWKFLKPWIFRVSREIDRKPLLERLWFAINMPDIECVQRDWQEIEVRIPVELLLTAAQLDRQSRKMAKWRIPFLVGLIIVWACFIGQGWTLLVPVIYFGVGCYLLSIPVLNWLYFRARWQSLDTHGLIENRFCRQ